MNKLTDEEKQSLVQAGKEKLLPILEKYELTGGKNEEMAVIEAFQAGIAYANELFSDPYPTPHQ